MIILLSPAKSLDFKTPVAIKEATMPQFVNQASQLMTTLRQQSALDLSKLMNLSDSLSVLNFERNQQWTQNHSAQNAKPAVYAFQGDVYQGLAAGTLTSAQVKRCQKHVRILSGLYGILRPLDLMQPYRLEMGTKLKNRGGKNLYDFWGNTLREAIYAELLALKSRLVINLASNEYSKAAKLKSLNAEVISPVFKDWKNGQYKLISFFAKRARGLMTRYLMTSSVKTADGIRGFDFDGYAYNAGMSSENTPVFTRKV
jgi:cytoplasmic iron level regulating protein YaaA (DUF328/UPF0246 family)